MSFLLYWLAGGLLEDAKKDKLFCEEFNRDLSFYVVQVGLIKNYWNVIEQLCLFINNCPFSFSTNSDSLCMVTQI